MSRVPDSESVVPPKLEAHDSVLQTKTGPQVHQVEPSVSLAGRQVIAGRYAILGQLGRGGMGEVWHAFDLKLRVDVALKSLRTDRVHQDVESLRREVRAAREVISPNVCRIFDLVVEDKQELVSMEFIDGTTLAELLQKQGPLELQKAADIASQFLAGLQAIHQAGLVHRDFKPENVMITRIGRVVVMDFGIAKPVAQFSETISGTPSYMAPEQLQGRRLDPRSDLFAAGVVLAEMIALGGVRSKESREALLAAIRQEPLQIPDHPWKKMIAQAVDKNLEHRFSSAAAMSRALEEVQQRRETTEDRRPYPGLSAFTKEDAKFFFGREPEIESILKKIEHQHLLAIIGPSGSGKTSLLHAGILPALSEGWKCVVCQPGDSPFVNLAQVFINEFPADQDAMRKMLRFEETDSALDLLRRWRHSCTEALIIVDRFEELFTLNTPGVQLRFAELLGRAALQSDVRILVVLRDDFLMMCRKYEALLPIFSEITGLLPVSGAALLQALTNPASACGYRFEDDSLIEEIIADVEKERGALPLLAFAASRLWEKRDRQLGILTRKAYQGIGGVAGALAQHAEATMDRIGTQRHEIAREIFRNLVTAQGTRAMRDMEELLSIFSNRKDAEEVLRALIDARLLTSFELNQDGKRRVEIIHESLLTAWPRLMRWRTQDADGAQLRDQLRQSAHFWEQRNRSSDLLWTGTAFLEFQAWHQRYTGKLTSTEDAYAHAMIQRASRQRKQRQLLYSTIIIVLISILTVITNFWRKENIARLRADSEARRAEASKLLALARFGMANSETAALAYTIASLEVADTPEARRFALETLWHGPISSIIPAKEIVKELDLGYGLQFSPNGKWLATESSIQIYIWPQNGSLPWIVKGEVFQFGPKSDHLITGSLTEPISIWSLNGKKLLRRVETMSGFPIVRRDRIFAFTFPDDGWSQISRLINPNAQPEILGKFYYKEDSARDIDPTATWIVTGKGSDIFLASLENPQGQRAIGRHPNKIHQAQFSHNGERLASLDDSGEIRIWLFDQGKIQLNRILKAARPGRGSNLQWNRSDTRIALGNASERIIQIWDLAGPPDAEPLVLRTTSGLIGEIDFHPIDGWLAAANYDRISFWPMNHQYAGVMRGHVDRVRSITFAGNNQIVTGGYDGTVRIWQLSGAGQSESKILLRNTGLVRALAFNKHKKQVLAGGTEGMFLIPLEAGQNVRRLAGPIRGVAFNADGRLAAGAPHSSQRGEMVLRIWDLDTGEIIKKFPLRKNPSSDDEEGGVDSIQFLPNGSLITAGQGGVRLWNLDHGTYEYLIPNNAWTAMTMSDDSPHMIARETEAGVPIFYDLNNRSSHSMTFHGPGRGNAIALDSTGRIFASGGLDGIVRVSSINNEEPHLLYGHEGEVACMAISDDGNWIASGGGDGTVRLWPMPKGKPFHILPYAEFLNRLKALTNVRVVADSKSSTGYRIDYDKFVGWGKVPTW
ncbi:MAG TPA: protein kinase [Acidobacteriota bacterium]|nr:protein kinase [Acidobacteriota bacterium]